MGPAIPFVAVAAAGSAAVINDRNESRREAREARKRAEEYAREVEERRKREEAEQKRKFEEEEKRRNEERKRLEEEKRRQEEIQRQEIERLKREKELEEKRIEREKAEKERIRQQKITEANKFYQNEKQNYENNKLKQILNDYETSQKKNFCLNKASQLDELIKKEINIIFKDLDKHIKTKVNDIYSHKLNEIKDLNDKKLRILLIGKSGVGKSTLINAIFDYDLAETGIGKPITMHIKPKKYEHYTQENLELFDTRGIELDPNYGLEKTSKMVEEFIKEQLKNKEPIKAIWYCVTGTRIEDAELELIKKLNSLYQNNSLPVIFVYTQCIDDIIFTEIKNYLETNVNNKANIIKILAKMKNINGILCKKYGLEDLLNKTKEIVEKNKEIIDVTTAKIKTKEEMKNILNENLNIENDILFQEKIEKIIFYYFQKFGNNALTQGKIKSFCNQYNDKCISIIKEELKFIVEKEAQKMKMDLSDILARVIKKYGNIISINQDGYYNEYQTKINNLLFNRAKRIGDNNINSKAEKTLEKEIKAFISSKINFYISSI